jgi:hypothetical protein
MPCSKLERTTRLLGGERPSGERRWRSQEGTAVAHGLPPARPGTSAVIPAKSASPGRPARGVPMDQDGRCL